jgi:hypothetical protein
MSRQGSRAGHNISRQNSSTNNNNNNNNSSNNNNNNKLEKEKENVGADGWTSVGTTPAVAPRSGRANELANFGKTRSKSNRNSVLGPSSSPFSSLSRSGSKTNDNKKTAEKESRATPPTTSMSNMFSALGGEEHEEEPAERKKLELLPRTTDEPEALEEEATASDEPKESDEVIERRSKNTIEEYFNLRDKKV